MDSIFIANTNHLFYRFDTSIRELTMSRLENLQFILCLRH